MLAIATAVLSLPLLLPGTMLVFMLEGQADDGPFYGRKASVGVKALAESESVPYKSGRIVVCNRVAERTPVMFFEDRRGEVRWAVEMDVLTKVEGLHISRGILRDVVHFTGWWTAGQEQGRAFIWKFNRFQRFYLSW
ncbi:MAG: hypothetical protein FJ279_04920 [Planctomycetes bacterium]|nr:hypothetical protein [Planctomycetota bacterium]MBM4078179.1 hypothetical protein [Planctomycetota bacterium]